jgi:hypothetical protein
MNIETIRCSEPDCNKVFREMMGHVAQVNSIPTDDEFACFGWVKQQKFLDGYYLGGEFGGKIVLEGENEFKLNERRNNHEVNINTCSFVQEYDGRFIIVEVDKKLKEQRLDALENGLVKGVKQHERGSGNTIGNDALYGPRYCLDHASQYKMACPECNEPLIQARSDVIGLRYGDDQLFMKMFLHGLVE